jgi:3-deoxy-D-manno-octulosonate 8-phosphate phosphatase (KDO 8-P phosphatase)
VKRIPSGVRSKAESVVLLLLDVDGVLTDGRIILDDRGIETKHFNVLDGQGISLLLRSGINVGIISSRSSRSVRYRAKELGISLVRQGVGDKLAAYNMIKRQRSLKDSQIAYMGDDIVDLAILRRVGFAVSVADAWPGLNSAVDYVTRMQGGAGAVREVAELLLKAQGKWAAAIARFD